LRYGKATGELKAEKKHRLPVPDADKCGLTMHDSTKSLNAARWLSQQAVADYLGCSVRTIQLLTKSGRLPVSYGLGPRLPRYDRIEVDRVLGQQQTGTPGA
jgi:predicted DNA-binding transcriptional regulator AlpA